MMVEELMAPYLEICTPDTKLSDAALRMWHSDCGALPVTDGNNRLVGMITDRDICIGLASRRQAPDQVCVGEVMSTGIRYCTPNEKIHQAMEKMAKWKIRRLPVLDEQGNLCGMLSLNDIILRAEQKRPGNRTRLQRITYEDAIQTLKAISRHSLPAVVQNGNGRS